MACGKAIVASDLPVLHEVLDRRTAVFVPPDNVELWVKAIDKLKNNDLRENLGDTALKIFLNRYTWEKRAQRIMECSNLHLL